MTSILTIMNPLGNLTGFLSPFMFVNPEEKDNEKFKSQIARFNSSHTTLAFIILAIIFILFRQNPNKQNQEKEKNTQPFKEQIQLLFSDGCYVCLFISGGLIGGNLGALGANLNTIFANYGFPQVQLF